MVHPATDAARFSETPASSLSRRGFLQAGAAAGGGLMLSLNLPLGKAEAADTFAPNAFVRIGSDGQIVLTMPYVEMGQGTYTSIPMLIAEELEVDLKQVRLEHAPPNEKFYVNRRGGCRGRRPAARPHARGRGRDRGRAGRGSRPGRGRSTGRQPRDEDCHGHGRLSCRHRLLHLPGGACPPRRTVVCGTDHQDRGTVRRRRQYPPTEPCCVLGPRGPAGRRLSRRRRARTAARPELRPGVARDRRR